jgi:hypothetical protein
VAEVEPVWLPLEIETDHRDTRDEWAIGCSARLKLLDHRSCTEESWRLVYRLAAVDEVEK